MRIPERKRRQHHVWQHYLKSWATDNQIWCLRDGNTFCTNTINVAVDRDFYKLAALNPDDLVLIKWLVIDPVNSVGKKYHQEFLAALTAPARFVEQYKASSTNPEELDEFLDIQRTNVLEDYHAGIENSFQPLLDDILNGDLTFYSDEKRCITFLHFICSQLMRTKRIKERAIEGTKKNGGKDISRIWDVISHMFAVNIGMSLYLERTRRTLALVHNHTDIPFVTGDQPVLNLHAQGTTPPETASLYYPVSPRLALLLTEVNETPTFTSDGLTSTQATALNMRMLEACHSQVFAETASELLFLKQSSG
jgi:uncharacterized protein DUF4238